MSIRLAVLALVAVFAFAPAKAHAQETVTEDQARALVQRLADEGLSVLRDTSMSIQDREAKFRSLLAQDFAMEYIGQVALGRYARQATPEQLAQYQPVFGEFVLLKYSNLLGGYTGQTLEVLRTSAAQPRDVFVATRVTADNVEPISASWRVRIMNGAPKIIDIQLEQVSMTISQQQEFASVIERDGMDGLIKLLQTQVEKLRTQRSGA